jgi:hypothetical protein
MSHLALTDCTPRDRSDDFDVPRVFRPECIGSEAERRIRAMSAETMHDELLWLLDSKQRPASQVALLENLIRTAIVAYMDAQPWQRSSRVMQAVKPVYEALHAEQCREIEGES